MPVVLLAYVLIAIAMTWPLATRLGTSIAQDEGDPAFNAWVLAWDMGQMSRLLGGDLGAIGDYWNANIFAPEPLTLAYSEHLTAPAVQALPIYLATGNLLTAYNVLFISTFVVASIGAFLLVRELTGQPIAAFLAGLAYAYVPYRMGQMSHVQILSSGWMPLALCGFHRYFARLADGASTRRCASALALAAVATVTQSLSCGYYMLFFAPFAAAVSVYEIVRRRVWGSVRMWIHLAVGAAAIAVATWPFVSPYFRLREITGLGTRPLAEVVGFSADAHAFATAPGGLRFIGSWVTGFFRPEGEGFQGFTIMAFAAVAVVWGLRRSLRTIPWKQLPDWHAIPTMISGVVAVLAASVMMWFFVAGNVTFVIDGHHVMYQHARGVLSVAMASFVAFAVLAAAARSRLAPNIERSAFGFYAVAAVMAALLCMGPQLKALGHNLGAGPYSLLYDYVPGFDGLRVPARLLMLVALFLSVLAGLGAAVLLTSRVRRLANVVVVLGMAGVLVEGWAVPIKMNLPVVAGDGFAQPTRLRGGRNVEPIYNVVKSLPGRVVMAEFPFGDDAYEMQWVFYAGHHLRPIMNGYSGFFPASYDRLRPVLKAAPENPAAVLEVFRTSGATHVLVHERAFLNGQGPALSAWLTSVGARLVTSDDDARLFALPRLDDLSGAQTSAR